MHGKPFQGVDKEICKIKYGNPDTESAFMENEDGSLSQAYVGYSTKPAAPVCGDCSDQRGVVRIEDYSALTDNCAQNSF